MRKKLKSITNKLYSVLGIAIILLLWQALCSFGIVADYMLPSPLAVCRAFAGSFSILMGHAKTSLIEALLGLVIGVVLAFVIAVVMDRFHVVYKPIRCLSSRRRSLRLQSPRFWCCGSATI